MSAAHRSAEDRIVKRLGDLAHLYPKLIDLGLDRVEALLADLGSPHLSLPPVLHIAGTNGKGSTLAFLRAMLSAADYRVHSYTSPHLVSFTERITLAGSPSEESAVLNAIARCEAVNAGRPITQFEIATVAAFLLFAESPADFLVLETGLGGRLDATNVVLAPLVSIITAIGRDHVDFLGDSIAGIAAEKGGIIKSTRPVVLGPQRYDDVLPVIADIAEQRGASLSAAGRDWQFDVTETGFTYQGGGLSGDFPAPALPGTHQYANAATAVAALEAARIDIAPKAVRDGLLQVDWPARLQRLSQGALAGRLADGWELWVDGGHNADAGRALADHAARDWADRPLVLAVGVMKSKDLHAFLSPFAGLAESLVAVPIPDQPNAQPPEAVVEIASALGIDCVAAGSLDAAIASLAGQPPGRLLFCGSLYLAGSVLAANAAFAGPG